MDDQGDPVDPFQQLYKSNDHPEERQRPDLDINPYDAFTTAWKQHWEGTALPVAAVAQEKVDKRAEWPTIWECEEVSLELMKLARVSHFENGLLANSIGNMPYAQQKEELQNDEHARAKLLDRLTVKEYCCWPVSYTHLTLPTNREV